MVSAGIAPSRPGWRPRPARRRGEEGYNLAMLIVGITILNIMVAVALPLWSYVIRRDREEETIFRGLQYAEAVRVFRQRNGRYPVSLEELVKIEPRSIRQLWREPLSKDGEFGLVVEAPPQQPAQPGQPGAPPPLPGTPAVTPTPPPKQVALPNAPAAGSNTSGGFGVGGMGGGAPNLIKLPRVVKDDDGDTVGTLATEAPLAIHGVYLDYEGDSLRKFFGKSKYEEWTFTAELIVPPVTAPGRPLPRVSDDWLGKSFPDGLSPVLGSGTGPGAPGKQGTQLGGAGGPGQPGQAPGASGLPGAGEAPQPDPSSEIPEELVPEADPIPDFFAEEEPSDNDSGDDSEPEEGDASDDDSGDN